MELMVFGLLIFSAVHLFPAFTVSRAKLIARLAEIPYKGLFSLLSFAGIALIIVGKGQAQYSPLWTPPAWGKPAAMILMIFSLTTLAAANLPSNIKRHTRHPLLWTVVLWSVAHLCALTDLASVVLFGGLAAYSLIAMVSANVRGAVKQQFAVPITKDFATVGAALAVYIALVFLHPYLFHVALLT